MLLVLLGKLFQNDNLKLLSKLDEILYRNIISTNLTFK